MMAGLMTTERFTRLPAALRAAAEWTTLTERGIPVMLVHPDRENGRPAPLVLWMHGRTAHKELDPGRYLRLMRAGIGVCAIDLPGHGERLDERLQQPEHTFEVVQTMIEEVDLLLKALGDLSEFDTTRLAIGGMSAGGMAALARLCDEHPFRCAAVEATSGSWTHQRDRDMFRHIPQQTIDQYDPMQRLDGWQSTPLLAIHARKDEWMSYEGQAAFVEALRRHDDQPDRIELVTFGETGAPYEHIGFGHRTAEAKEAQVAFFRRWLQPEQ